MGRPRKVLNFSTGHYNKNAILQKQLQEQSIRGNMDQIKKPPKWLRDNIAKKEYKRLLKQLQDLGIVNNLDVNNLGAYCNAYSGYLQATQQLKTEPLTIDYKNKNGTVNKIQNPLVKIQLQYSAEMQKYSRLLGLSIDSRLKLAGIKVNKKEQQIASEFGDV